MQQKKPKQQPKGTKQVSVTWGGNGHGHVSHYVQVAKTEKKVKKPK